MYTQVFICRLWLHASNIGVIEVVWSLVLNYLQLLLHQLLLVSTYYDVINIVPFCHFVTVLSL